MSLFILIRTDITLCATSVLFLHKYGSIHLHSCRILILIRTYITTYGSILHDSRMFPICTDDSSLPYSHLYHFELVSFCTPDSAPFTLAHLSPALMTFSPKTDTFTKCFRALYVCNLPMFVIS